MAIFRVTYSGVLPAGDIWTTGYHVTSTDTVSAVVESAGLWLTSFWNGVDAAPGYKTICNAGVVVTSSAAYELSPIAPYKVVASERGIFDLAGTDVANSLPQEVSPLISMRTSTPGPGGRGRMYLPCTATDTASAVGNLASAAATVIENAAFNAWTVTNGAFFQPVLFKRGTGGEIVINEFNVPDVFAVQRRRVNKVSRTRGDQTMPGA